MKEDSAIDCFQLEWNDPSSLRMTAYEMQTSQDFFLFFFKLGKKNYRCIWYLERGIRVCIIFEILDCYNVCVFVNNVSFTSKAENFILSTCNWRIISIEILLLNNQVMNKIIYIPHTGKGKCVGLIPVWSWRFVMYDGVLPHWPLKN